MLNMCEGASKLPQIQYSWNNPNIECFYLVIQVRSTHLTTISGLMSTVVASNSKLAPTQRQFWVHGGAENFKIMTWIQNLPYPC